MDKYGIGFQLNFYTSPLMKAVEQAGGPIDFVEILCDTVSGPIDGPHVIDPKHVGWFHELRAQRKLIAHSNYGEEYGFRPLEETPFVKRHIPIVHEMRSPWVTDHMFYGTPSTSYLWSTPVQFSYREVNRIAERAARLQDLLKVPLLHENAFIYAQFPGSDIEEAEFLSELTHKAGTYLHLDLHNIYANSLNFEGYDRWKFLQTIPLDRVIQIHIAGGQWIDGWYHDLHNHSTPEPVWEMLRYVLVHGKNVRAISLEIQGVLHTAMTRAIDGSFAEMAKADLLRARSLWEEVDAAAV